MRTNRYVQKPLRRILCSFCVLCSCSLLGRSSPCTFSEWNSHPMLTPGQKPTENRRAKSCPGVGQCTEVRAWKAGKYPFIYMQSCLPFSFYPQPARSQPCLRIPRKNSVFLSQLFKYTSSCIAVASKQHDLAPKLYSVYHEMKY